MINDIWIEIDINQIKERYNKLKEFTKAQIIPVIKNNANGLGFNAILEIYKSLGVSMVAASYASEFYLKAKDDDIQKLAWIWSPTKKLLEVKNLILCCKDFEQLKFCIENKIPYHLIFNIGMNRGGFLIEDLKQIELLINPNKNIVVATHCPYENKRKIINVYRKNLNNLINYICLNTNLTISFIHAANSCVFRTDPACHFDGVRLGEALLLPNNDKFGLYNPFEIKTKILHIMNLNRGDNIGYNISKVKAKKLKVGVIPVGYYNFDKIKGVLVKDTFCPVLAQMHDLSLIDISKVENVSKGNEVIIQNFLLSRSSNWNKCIQRTFKFNPDLINYKYKE